MPRFVLVMCGLVVAAFVLGVSGSAGAAQFSAAFS
jgi:hypothetical protein